MSKTKINEVRHALKELRNNAPDMPNSTWILKNLGQLYVDVYEMQYQLANDTEYQKEHTNYNFDNWYDNAGEITKRLNMKEC